MTVEAYFVIGDATGQNHFRANRIGLWSNIWGDKEKLFMLCASKVVAIVGPQNVPMP
ncbi:hypothetical protein [Nostoc sp.]|uniref:hypothetical protein n=1 Tax=Nostoc sp. TaxID=1180 RepID=UPI002FF4E93A